MTNDTYDYDSGSVPDAVETEVRLRTLRHAFCSCVNFLREGRVGDAQGALAIAYDSAYELAWYLDPPFSRHAEEAYDPYQVWETFMAVKEWQDELLRLTGDSAELLFGRPVLVTGLKERFRKFVDKFEDVDTSIVETDCVYINMDSPDLPSLLLLPPTDTE